MKIIHIGKCGGSSLNTLFKDKHEIIHLKPVINNGIDDYLIIIRNPIQRFISAFNWRYRLVIEENKKSYPSEKELLLKYKTVNNLINDIHNFKGYIHHIHEDIHFYLKDFDFSKGNVEVVTTENLNEDIYNLFGLVLRARLKENKKETILTPLEYITLKEYLSKDYSIIEQMYNYGIISKEKYQVLIK
jgi:hypothetical protein